MFARAAKTRAAPMIKAAARISEFYQSAGRWQWVVGGRIDGRLLDVGFMLLASVLQAASPHAEHQKQAATLASPFVTLSYSGACCAVEFLATAHRCAHVFDQSSLHTAKCDEPSQP